MDDVVHTKYSVTYFLSINRQRAGLRSWKRVLQTACSWQRFKSQITSYVKVCGKYAELNVNTSLTCSLSEMYAANKNQYLLCAVVELYMLLCQVCMETMKKLKANGHLEIVNIDQLFANLTEICSVRLCYKLSSKISCMYACL